MYLALIRPYFVLELLSSQIEVKAVKASINVSNVSFSNSTLLWHAKKERYLHKVSMFAFKKNPRFT